MINAIHWIFFDIGSTLIDEEEAYNHRIRDMIQGTSVTFEQFCEKRILYAKEGYNGDQKAIEYFGLTKTPWHSEDEAPFDDCNQTLQKLCDRGYKLGGIANQKSGAKARLDTWGLGRYFSVIASSAEMGVSKPDRDQHEATAVNFEISVALEMLSLSRKPITVFGESTGCKRGRTPFSTGDVYR